MSFMEYASLLGIPHGFKAAKHLLLAVAVWLFWVGYTAGWTWFFFVYLPSFDVYKVLPVLAVVFVGWLLLWAGKIVFTKFLRVE